MSIPTAVPVWYGKKVYFDYRSKWNTQTQKNMNWLLEKYILEFEDRLSWVSAYLPHTTKDRLGRAVFVYL